MVGPEISGEKVSLRPLRNDDLARRVAWLNDAETARLFTGLAPDRAYAFSEAERWRHSIESDPMARAWAIEAKDGRHIGDVDLHDICRLDGSARLTILIGDAECRDQGYGTDAVKAVLCYAFEEMRLESVNLRVCDFNRRAVRCYEKCGFERTSVGSGPRDCRRGDTFMIATRERFQTLNPASSQPTM